ncbi:DgyrCDS3558 [Dimorphilus gyrociliatus]|uniref:DgyrCDS3558 n=1 Tax=Dimorphilus gyrociliatus TaxID=2664684 RepID=A0A7I8VE33_9ANNE|nr:DgyrCDS3558 [Dimorphilus gyrociliatus]
MDYFSNAYFLLIGFVLLSSTVVMPYSVSLSLLAICFSVLYYFKEKKSTIKDKVVIITGCDSGFGNQLARLLDSKGAIVFAGCLDEKSKGALDLKMHCTENLRVVKLNITLDEDVINLCKIIESFLIKSSKELWALVNNAGLNFLGEVEWTPLQLFEKVLNVNMYGTIRMSKAFLPFLRKSQGRLINVTSVKGRLSYPANGPYTMSKHAITTFTDQLRMELKPFNVKVILAEPGNFGGSTGMLLNNERERELEIMWESSSDDVKETYGKEYIFHYLKAIKNSIPTANKDLNLVSMDILKALTAVHPYVRYTTGGSCFFYDYDKLLMNVSPYLPTVLIDYLMTKYCYAGFPNPIKALKIR